ncbi:hypothetical protein EC835_101226 [Providencia alcalifaciens]|uniref:Uncharacterized protein n=1 Tax=Providencia alcalifaciens TaxID=126385 RepID=A0A4R3NYG8_9GAMM|nr:hypothetical protein EC835_101226 [Providencia alcalifaciens]
MLLSAVKIVDFVIKSHRIFAYHNSFHQICYIIKASYLNRTIFVIDMFYKGKLYGRNIIKFERTEDVTVITKKK